MNRLIRYSAAFAALACLTTTSVSGQDAATKERLKRQNQTTQSDRAYAGRLDGQTQGSTIRASQLIGMNIQNAEREGVGEINDIVLDTSNGKIRYAAVTYGGFLGLGDKLFAVPFEAFKFQRDPDDQDDYVLVLNVTQEQLEGDKGFDQNEWPNFADQSFTSQVDKRYGVNRQMDRADQQRRQRGDVDVDVSRRGVDVDVDRENE